MRLEFSKHTEQELDSIYDYISQKSEPAAIKLYNDILDEINRLLLFPQMASVEPLLIGEPAEYRSLVIRRNYKIIYRIKDEIIYIVDIWDCRQQPGKLKERIVTEK